MTANIYRTPQKRVSAPLPNSAPSAWPARTKPPDSTSRPSLTSTKWSRDPKWFCLLMKLKLLIWYYTCKRYLLSRLSAFYVVLFFLISLVMEYVRLYLEKSGVRYARMQKNRYYCNNDGHWMPMVMSSIKRLVSWDGDYCENYYRDVYITPVFDVHLSDVLLGMVLRPINYILNNFLSGLVSAFQTMPIVWQVGGAVISLSLVLVSAFFAMGYGIRLPFLDMGPRRRT